MHWSEPEQTSTVAVPADKASRIIAAETLRGVSSFRMGDLSSTGATPRPLGQRDLDNEVARAAYTLGRRRGFEQGTQEGQQRGYSEGSRAFEDFQSRQAAEVAQQMQALVSAFRTEMKSMESRLSQEVVALAVGMARQVVRRELTGTEGALLPIAAEALRALGEGASQLELRVHPDDAAALRAHLEMLPAAQSWRLLEDAQISRGGCRIEADTGIADATLETRWQAVLSTMGFAGGAS